MTDPRFETVKPASLSIKKKPLSLEETLVVLNLNKIDYTLLNDGKHIRIPIPQTYSTLNYYPTTGTMNLDGQSRFKGKGLECLLDYLSLQGFTINNPSSIKKIVL